MTVKLKEDASPNYGSLTSTTETEENGGVGTLRASRPSLTKNMVNTTIFKNRWLNKVKVKEGGLEKFIGPTVSCFSFLKLDIYPLMCNSIYVYV